MVSQVGHPYRDLPPQAFWKTAVAQSELATFDPLGSLPFRITKLDRVATAGSCFAQHISKALIHEDLDFLRVETAPEPDADKLPIYSARYGNIYTSRQLHQLFKRAYGLFTPRSLVWQRPDGRYIDAFRPSEFPAGFATADDVEAEAERHLAAVRTVFESCDVFVFTLGLTEVWLSDLGGVAVPLPPGVVGAPVDPGSTFSPVNLSAQALSADLLAFIDDMRLINPTVRFLITVSPVPIIATFEDRHVIVSNAYTKAALRVVANTAATERRDVLYFPSYEMIVTHPKARYFDENYRAVAPAGIEAVMRVFRQRILLNEGSPPSVAEPDIEPAGPSSLATIPLEREFKSVICDEEMLGWQAV